MSLMHIQTCERCGESRNLSRTDKDRPDTGGWRTLTSGSLEATFCNLCVRTLVVAAREAADKRTGVER